MSDIVSRNILTENGTAFFLCDVQEKFRPAISHFNEIVEIIRRLVEASKILEIPLIVTEQYPKGLGPTVSELDISHASVKLEKTKFTMYNQQVEEFLKEKSIKNVVLFGVETHVCVLQTAIDLIKNGYGVHLVADGCSSRTLKDRLFAFDRLRQMNAIVTTHESVLFQLISDKNHSKFKEIQNILKDIGPDTGLTNNK